MSFIKITVTSMRTVILLFIVVRTSNIQTLYTTSQESEIADRAIRSDLLSMERLLVHTIYVRTRSRLTELKQELQTMLKDVECKYHCLCYFFDTSFVMCNISIKNLLLDFRSALSLVASLKILIIVTLKLGMSCPTVHVRMLHGRLRILEEVEKKQIEKEIRIADCLRQGLNSFRCSERCHSVSVITSLLTMTLLCLTFPVLRSRVIIKEDLPFQVIYKVLLLSCQFQCCSPA